MTYCIGVKTQTEVLIAADSALTFSDEKSGVSSFGETSARNRYGYVLEAGLKVFRVRNSAFTFAGDIGLGYEIARVVKNYAKTLSREVHIEDYRNAIISVIRTDALHVDIQVMIGIHKW